MLLLVLAASTASCLGQSTATTSVISQPAIKDFQPLGKPPELNPVEPIKEFEPLGKTPALKPVEPLVDWLPIWGKSAREKGYDLPLPFGVAGALGAVAELGAGLIAPPITADQAVLLRADNVCAGGYPGLAALGITPTTLEAVLPTYLYRYRKGGQYADQEDRALAV